MGLHDNENPVSEGFKVDTGVQNINEELAFDWMCPELKLSRDAVCWPYFQDIALLTRYEIEMHPGYRNENSGRFLNPPNGIQS